MKSESTIVRIAAALVFLIVMWFLATHSQAEVEALTSNVVVVMLGVHLVSTFRAGSF